MAAKIPVCGCGCGRPLGTTGAAHGWRNACVKRWLRAERPESGPPAPMSHAARCAVANAARKAAAAARSTEYARLRDARYTAAQAALRLGMGQMARLAAEHAYQSGKQQPASVA